MRSNLTEEHFKRILLGNTPLMDVRAPIEFGEGAFPSSINVPILDDQQRQRIGTVYKADGQNAAIELGFKLATPELREQRIQAWKQFVLDNPEGYLYCFRGGMRSRITQQWLQQQAGLDYPLIEGGYKALRRFLLGQLERLGQSSSLLLLAGATGVGKTELIVDAASSIDLEGRANHRGSAFGQTFVAQPAQISWENQVIIDWLRCETQGRSPILVEAESHLIGRIHLPHTLRQAMQAADIVVLEADMSARVMRLFNDYVNNTLDYTKRSGDDPWSSLQKSVQHSLNKIKKRLGVARWQSLSKQLPVAVESLREQDDPSVFHAMIENLLMHYYDPMYQHHQIRKQNRIVFRGERAEVEVWLQQRIEESADAGR